MIRATTLAAAIAVSSSASAAAQESTKDGLPTTKQVCADAREDLKAARIKYGERHPNLLAAVAAEKVGCKPAPSGGCARARMEKVRANLTYGKRHPKIASTQIQEKVLCDPKLEPVWRLRKVRASTTTSWPSR